MPARPSPDWHWTASSFISGIRYVGPGWMDVQFHPDGFRARYFGVPVELFQQFLNSSSKGKFWHAHFRNWADWTEL